MIGRLLPRRRIHDDASAFVDGALRSRDREAFAHHLAVCAACQSAVAQLRDTKGMLKALGTEVLPRSFTLSSAMVARSEASPGPAQGAAGWGSLGVPRLAASVSIMMAAALIAAVVIDLDDGSGATAVRPVSRTASQAAVLDEVAPAVAKTTASAVAQAPEAGARAESVLLVEGAGAPTALEQDALDVVEVESVSALEFEEVIEEAFVAAVPELLDIFLPGSDGFGSVALVAPEGTDDQTARAGDLAPEGDVDLGVAAIEVEIVAEPEKETPVDVPGDESLGGQAGPAVGALPEASEDGGSSLVQGEGETALDVSEDGGLSLDDGESSSARGEEAEAAPPADAGDVAVDILAPGHDVAQPAEEASSGTAEPESDVSTDVPVEDGDSDEISDENSDLTEPSAVAALLDEPASSDAAPVDANVSLADAEITTSEDLLAVSEAEDEAGDAQTPDLSVPPETDPAVVQESLAALPSSADPTLDGAQGGGLEAVPIITSEPDSSQRRPAAGPTSRPVAAPLSVDSETSVPWLRPLQIALGIVAGVSAVLAVAVWLRRRAWSF